MKNKNGFTLIELLVVIAIIALLILIAVPAALKIYNENVIKSMYIQEAQVKDAANLFVEDYCNSPIDQTMICPKSYSTPVNDKKTVCLQDLQNSSDKYIGTIKYKGSDCKGYVTYYYDSKLGTYENPKTYLFCGKDKDNNYEYVTNNDYDFKEYCKCNDDEKICGSSYPSLYDVLKDEEMKGGLVKKYSGTHRDSLNIAGDKDIYYYRAETNDDVNKILNKNNVLFGNYCWQIIRTTDMGGVRLLYNGEPNVVDGKKQCYNDTVIRSIGKSKFNDGYDSIGYVGYMYNKNETKKYKTNYKKMTFISSGGNLETYTYKYSNGFEYKNGNYYLKNDIKEISNVSPLSITNRHYTCFSNSDVCENGEIYYITGLRYDGDDYHIYYIILKNGNSVEDALNSMINNDNVNKDNSIIKTYIEDWFEKNMLDFAKYLEDSVYCNDRSVIDYGNWASTNNVTGYGMGYETIKFKNYNLNDELYCKNITDRFSVSNDKAKLKYPVGLISLPELHLLKKSDATSPNTSGFYTISPLRYFSSSEVVVGNLYDSNNFQAPNGYYLTNGLPPNVESYVKPMITLSYDAGYSEGNGSASNPYVIYTK